MKAGGRQRPISKKTETLLASLRRRRGERELARRFLIVCEDKKSAPGYFKALIKHFSLAATSVRVAHSEGRTQPVQVVEKAKELKQGEEREVPFDEVWCVIDGDFGKKIAAARSKAKAHGIQLAVSTMCFEYWLLLHFEENDKSAHDCQGHIARLRKHVSRYEKGRFDFLPIVAHVRDACQRAEKLRRSNDLPEDQNPCSEVFLLINAMGDFIR